MSREANITVNGIELSNAQSMAVRCAVSSVRTQVSARVAFRVARFAKVSVDDVLHGRFPAPGTCPHCGHCPEVK